MIINNADGRAPITKGEQSSAVSSPAPGKKMAQDVINNQTLAAVMQANAQYNKNDNNAEQQKFTDISDKLKHEIENNPDFKAVKEQILIKITTNGLQIELIDLPKKTMFTNGSANMSIELKNILKHVVKLIAPLANKISITGHTDSIPYRGEQNYTNWELSADRANAARRMMVASGIAATRFYQVIGKADIDPLLPKTPLAPQNRRISITLIADKALAALTE